MQKETKSIPFSTVFELLVFGFAAEQSRHVGALGPITWSEMMRRLDSRVSIALTDEELEHLTYMYKQAIVNKTELNVMATPLFKPPRNYNALLTRVAAARPELFTIDSKTKEVKERE